LFTYDSAAEVLRPLLTLLLTLLPLTLLPALLLTLLFRTAPCC
jgi:hypothetical protein